MRDEFIKDESGFSLLEVVLSIGMLAFLSVFILQMFMVSATANHRARDIDIASYTAIGVIEEIKACNLAGDILGTGFIANTQVAFGLSDYFIIGGKPGGNSYDFSKEFVLYKYYNSAWESIDLDKVTDDPDNPEDSGIKFILKLNMNADMEYEGFGGSLLKVNVTVSSRGSGSNMHRLASYDTKVYFETVGEIYGY